MLKGESWEDGYDEGGYIEQSHDDKFGMHINYDAGYAYTSVDNIKYCPFCGAELTMPKEPLIKDEKVRKAVRAWAEANGVKKVIVEKDFSTYTFYPSDTDKISISVWTDPSLSNLSRGNIYAITELCEEEE